jgi:hypothetical protein
MAKKAKEPSQTCGVVEAARHVASDLEAIGVRFALIGGLAVGARTEPRFTRNVDLGGQRVP